MLLANLYASGSNYSPQFSYDGQRTYVSLCGGTGYACQAAKFLSYSASAGVQTLTAPDLSGCWPMGLRSGAGGKSALMVNCGGQRQLIEYDPGAGQWGAPSESGVHDLAYGSDGSLYAMYLGGQCATVKVKVGGTWQSLGQSMCGARPWHVYSRLLIDSRGRGYAVSKYSNSSTGLSEYFVGRTLDGNVMALISGIQGGDLGGADYNRWPDKIVAIAPEWNAAAYKVHFMTIDPVAWTYSESVWSANVGVPNAFNPALVSNGELAYMKTGTGGFEILQGASPVSAPVVHAGGVAYPGQPSVFYLSGILAAENGNLLALGYDSSSNNYLQTYACQ